MVGNFFHLTDGTIPGFDVLSLEQKDAAKETTFTLLDQLVTPVDAEKPPRRATPPTSGAEAVTELASKLRTMLQSVTELIGALDGPSQAPAQE